MKQISTLSPYSMAKVGTRVFCKKCEKETAFFRSKCLECGTVWHKQMRGTGKRMTFSAQLEKGKQSANVRDDRRDYWKRKAEESRAKFEGPK